MGISDEIKVTTNAIDDRYGYGTAPDNLIEINGRSRQRNTPKRVLQVRSFILVI